MTTDSVWPAVEHLARIWETSPLIQHLLSEHPERTASNGEIPEALRNIQAGHISFATPPLPRNFTRVRVLPGREPVRIVHIDFGVPGKATAPRVVRGRRVPWARWWFAPSWGRWGSGLLVRGWPGRG